VTSLPSVITEYARVSRKLISEAGSILLQANTAIRRGNFDPAQMAKTAQELMNVALSASVEATSLTDPISWLSNAFGEWAFSDYITVDADDKCQRALSVANRFVQVGAPSRTIPEQSILFQPAILPVNVSLFRVGVRWSGLTSGTYEGAVRLSRINTDDGAGPDEVPVTIDL
jgi:hypothetical protein